MSKTSESLGGGAAHATNELQRIGRAIRADLDKKLDGVSANEGESWANDYCVHCNARNWVCMGDLTDCTSNTGNEPVCRCWSCKKVYWRAGTLDDIQALVYSDADYDEEKSPAENLPDMPVVDGLESPNGDGVTQ